eukprot:NP_495000.1 Uncharacterized protein CELE_F09E5.10 [Caenorhabditis elegans]
MCGAPFRKPAAQSFAMRRTAFCNAPHASSIFDDKNGFHSISNRSKLILIENERFLPGKKKNLMLRVIQAEPNAFLEATFDRDLKKKRNPKASTTNVCESTPATIDLVTPPASPRRSDSYMQFPSNSRELDEPRSTDDIPECDSIANSTQETSLDTTDSMANTERFFDFYPAVFPEEMDHDLQETSEFNLLCHNSYQSPFEDEETPYHPDWFLTNSKSHVLRSLMHYRPIANSPRGVLEMAPEYISENSSDFCISTKRGAPLVIFNNQSYRPRETLKNGDIVARCNVTLENSRKCPGSVRIKTETGHVKVSRDCDHESRRSEIAVQLIMRKIAVSSMSSSPSKERLYELAVTLSKRYEVVELLKSNKEISRILDGMLSRKSTNSFPPALDSAYFKGGKCCLDSSGTFESNKDLLVVWQAEEAESLYGAHSLHLDGKFSEIPKNYRQLYIATVTDLDTNVAVPLVFALCGSAKEDLYRRKRWLYLLNLSTYPDFEVASVNASRAVWPNADIFGCWRHFKVNLFKNLRKAVGDDINKPEFVNLLKSIYTLSFAPHDKISSATSKNSILEKMLDIPLIFGTVKRGFETD